MQALHEHEAQLEARLDLLKGLVSDQVIRISAGQDVTAVKLAALTRCAASDIASAFGFRPRTKMFQFMQRWLKLVGEIVGEGGRKHNPAFCEAIRKWPEHCNLKDLQGFLGPLFLSPPPHYPLSLSLSPLPPCLLILLRLSQTLYLDRG